MTPAEFKAKWRRFKGKETSGYVTHFDDLCRMLGQPTPAEADPSGTKFFCFQKRVVKDLELFSLSDSGEETPPEERGFADVWKKACFAWEYKGKKKDLEAAYRQLLRYREALENPPLLVVCDFDRFIVRTNFNGAVQQTYEFANEQIDQPEIIRILRALFDDPESLRPKRTTAQVTEEVARQIADLARSIQARESVELADAKTRKEVQVAQKKNLRIARFLNRIVFCFFAEDAGLLPHKLFSQVLQSSLHDPQHFAQSIESLFRVMATGGLFGQHRIRHFNGHLFEDSTVFELTEEEIAQLAQASDADWQFIQPSIMGNLFERGLDPDQRAQLGAHYTSEEDIRTLVEPVLMAPLRREWAEVKAELMPALAAGKGTAAQRKRLADFLNRLATITILDPACGSGNFLYVALRELLDLEKEALTLGAHLGFRFDPQVNVQQLKAIELNAYAFELAQVTVQIGYLQWRRDNGFDNDRTPVLQVLDGFENKDALLNQTFRKKSSSLKEAQAEEHAQDETVKVYTERAWPECEVIVGNPPFLGDKLMRRELGDEYVEELRHIYGDRIPGQSDLCCYWFEKARDLIERGHCKRAGLLATQGIRGGANREVLKRIKSTGDIFFGESDREWILAGANVHVSMVGFDGAVEKQHVLNGKSVASIGPQLTSVESLLESKALCSNAGVSFMGITPSGPFVVPNEVCVGWLREPNVHNRPNSDVVRPWVNGSDITGRSSDGWVIDFFDKTDEREAGLYAAPFAYVQHHVQTARKAYRTGGKLFWQFERARPEMRAALANHVHYTGRSMVGKHQFYVWLPAPILPANLVIVFARSDDEFFGILHSRLHEVWALKQGTRLETRPRYTPTTCFETFALSSSRTITRWTRTKQRPR